MKRLTSLNYGVLVSVEEKWGTFLKCFLKISVVVKWGTFLTVLKYQAKQKTGTFLRWLFKISVEVKRRTFLRWTGEILVKVKTGTFLLCFISVYKDKKNVPHFNVCFMHWQVNYSEKVLKLWVVGLFFAKRGLNGLRYWKEGQKRNFDFLLDCISWKIKTNIYKITFSGLRLTMDVVV